MKKDSQAIYIKKALSVHNRKYDYSKLVYKNSRTKVKIVCKEHGVFTQNPQMHLKGFGCPKCSNYGRINSKADFIRKAESKHGPLYDYKKVSYEGSFKPVIIICKEHGEFKQTPGSHLYGRGCPNCSKSMRLTTPTFVKKARTVHGDTFSYDNVVYVKWNKKVSITCKTHGDFNQTPNSHLNGHGCPACKISRVGNKFRKKAYTLGNKVVYIQGFEPFAIDYLVQQKSIRVSDIVVGNSVPKVVYYDNKKKKNRTHVPDIYIPAQNRLVEVKSQWTFRLGFKDLKLKRAAAIAQGYRYSVLLMNAKGERIPLPENWFSRSKCCA